MRAMTDGRDEPDVFGATTRTVVAEGEGTAPPRVTVHRASGASVSIVDGQIRVVHSRTGQLGWSIISALLDDLGVETAGLPADDLERQLQAKVERAQPGHDLTDLAEIVAAAASGARDRGAEAAHVRASLTARMAVVWAPDAKEFLVTSVRYLRLRVTARRDGVDVVRSWGGGRLPAPGDAWTLGRDAGDELLRARDAVPVVPGSADVIFSPSAAGYLVHESIGHALEGTRLGRRNVLRQEGFQLDPQMTVTEHASDPGAWVGAEYDDEGTRTKPTVLVAEGRVRGTLTTRSDVTLDGMAGGGSARRADHASPALPRMRHTVLSKGATDPSEVLADTRSGIYVDEIDFASADPATGAFILRIQRGRMVEFGSWGPWVRPHVVRGNVTDLRLVDVCSDAAVDLGICGRGNQWLPVSYSSPTLRVRSLLIGGGAS